MSTGKIQVTDEAIASIVQSSVKRVEGVNDFVGGIVDGISGMLGQTVFKGIFLDLNGEKKVVTVNIAIERGFSISEVGKKVQNNIREDIKAMLGIDLHEVNVRVDKICH